MENVTQSERAQTHKRSCHHCNSSWGLHAAMGPSETKGKVINTMHWNSAFYTLFATGMEGEDVVGAWLNTRHSPMVCTGCWCSKSSWHHKLRIMLVLFFNLKLFMIN